MRTWLKDSQETNANYVYLHPLNRQGSHRGVVEDIPATGIHPTLLGLVRNLPGHIAILPHTPRGDPGEKAWMTGREVSQALAATRAEVVTTDGTRIFVIMKVLRQCSHSRHLPRGDRLHTSTQFKGVIVACNRSVTVLIHLPPARCLSASSEQVLCGPTFEYIYYI